MAIAIAGTAETAVTTAGTTHAVTLPAGGASTDLYLLIGSIGSTAATLNALTDWTELLDENAAIGLKILIYTGAGVPGNPSFTSSGSTRSAWIAYRLTGVDKTTTPQIGTTGTGTSLTPDPPSVTPTGGTSKEYLFIAFAGMAGEEADDDTWGNTPPTNYTPSPPRQKACGTVGTNLGGLILSAERLLTTGAAQDPGTFGVDVSAAWRSQTIIVHPLETHLGAAAASNTTPRSTATGAKGGSTSTVISARAQTTTSGQKNATSAAAASNTTPRATATGGKNFASAATASNTTPRATVIGGRLVTATASATNTTPRATATGAKGGTSAATASASARNTATGAKTGTTTATASNTTRAVATGAKAGTSAAALSNTARVTATGAASAETHSGSAAASATASATATGRKDGRRGSRIGLNVGPGSFELFRDEFDGSVLSNAWDDSFSFGNISPSGGALTFDYTGVDQDGEIEIALADFEGRSISVENLDDIIGGSGVGDATVYFGVRTRIVGVFQSTALVRLNDDSGGMLQFRLSDTRLGTNNVEIAYDRSTMAFWRIRAEGDAIIWETSPDRAAWTVRRVTTADGFAAPERLDVAVFIGFGGVLGTESGGRLDDFRIEGNGEPHDTAAGQKNAAGAATASAATRATATGSRTGQGVATASAAPRATATGLKGGQSAAACSAQARCTATGAEGGQTLITASARPTATATGLKGGQSAATCFARPQATATGAEGSQTLITASARATATGTGTKAGQGTATVSAKPRATATIADRFNDDASASARATCSSSGVKGGQGAATGSTRPATTTAGQKNAAGAATASAAATATTVSGRSVSGSAAASAAARSAVSGAKGGRSAASAAESSEASASGEKTGAAAAAGSARGRAIAVGTRTASGATTATASASATASGAKNATSAAAVSAPAVVTATQLVIVFGSASFSNTTPRVTAGGGRTPTVTYGTILEGAGRGQVRSASDYSGVRALHPDPPTIVVD